MLQLRKKKLFIKIKRIYGKFSLFLYGMIKNPLFQKILLIFLLISSITLSIASLALGIRIYSHTWFFLPTAVGFFTIPLFFIPIIIYFLKNLDLFDYFCQRAFSLFVKPWVLPFIIIFFSLGFYFIYSRLNLPDFTYFLVILPIFPLYVVQVIFELYTSPTEFKSLTWIGFFNLLLLIPLMIYCYHFIGKKILSKIKIVNIDNSENLFAPKKGVKLKRNDLNLKKSLITIWVVSAIICFLILINSNFGFDTPYYYIFVKDYFETGNLDLIFNQSSKSEPIFEERTFSFIPITFILIFFAFICGGDIILGSVIMHTVFFSIAPPLIILITNNITGSSRIGIRAGIIFLFSLPILMLLIGILRQFLSVILILIALYLLFCKFNNNWKKYIARSIGCFVIIFQAIFYVFILGLIYFILTQYFLRKKSINFRFLKNPKIYKLIKITTIYILFGLILFFFFFGFFLDAISKIFNLYIFSREYYFQSCTTTPQSDFNIFNAGFNFSYLGICFIFIVMGIYVDQKEKVIKNPKIKFYLISFLECILIFTLLDLFGFKFFAKRMIYYVPIPGSIFSAIGITELKKIFPKIWNKTPRIQNLVQLSLIFTLISSFLFGASYVRNGYVAQEELDALEWFKTRPDYDKLIDKNISDVNIICNSHLMYWAQYRLHYNIINRRYNIDSLEDLHLETNLKHLRTQSQEKLYIFISNNTEQFRESWTMDGLIEFFNEYREDYTFNWNNYTINSLVVVWEIEYAEGID